MVVLIDTNVAINYLTNRTDENSVASSRLMTLCGEKTVEGYIIAHAIPIIWYVLRKYPEQDRRTMLRNLCTVLSVAGLNQGDVLSALDREEFSDFEDCLLAVCAESAGCEVIVTRNAKDFGNSAIPAMTPEEFGLVAESEAAGGFANENEPMEKRQTGRRR